MELHCYMCDEDKGLEDFAKAQRSKPDHAVCARVVSNEQSLTILRNVWNAWTSN